MDYKKLEIYDFAHNLVLEFYILLKDLPKCEDNNLTSQIRRSITCLPLNIAEGSGARSNKIFLNYLIFCYRSCQETQASLKLTLDLNYITKTKYEYYYEMLDHFTRKLYKFMQYLESKCNDRKKDKTYFYRYNKFLIDSKEKSRENFEHLS